MLDLLRMRIVHGNPLVKNLQKAQVAEPFRAFPVLDDTACTSSCTECIRSCPVQAISAPPLSLDLGTCTFCGACESACPYGAISFTKDHHIAADKREKLVLRGRTMYWQYVKDAVQVSREIKKYFGRSLKLRQVSAGGCNACELELNACSNVNFDMGRYGIEFVASPRHSDGIVITGPISANMAKALENTYASIPEPKIIILCGSCAISGGLFASSPEIDRSFPDNHTPDLFVPGCPPHPLTFINGILNLIGKK